MAVRRQAGGTGKSPRASGVARDIHRGVSASSGIARSVTAQPTASAESAIAGSARRRRTDRIGSSGERDVDLALVPAAGGVVELNAQRAGIGRPERKGEEGVLTHALGGVEHDDRLRSEEHTSELQSPDHLVCRLLLEKKKKQQTTER